MSRAQPATHAAPPSAPPPTTSHFNKAAIWSLVLSILWLGGLGSIAGIILGVSSRRRIAGTGERGAGVATAGIAVGVVTLVIAIAYWAFIATHVGGGISHGGSGGGNGGGGYGY